jgi:hypothetical protein
MSSIAQAFSVNYSLKVNIPGTYLTSIGVFFKSKSATNGVTLAVCPTINGYPDTTKTIGSAHLQASQVTVSDDATAETIFTFSTPVLIENTKTYAFFISTDGGNPDYDVWVSELGGTDTITGNYISQQTYAGSLFTSSAGTTWTTILTQNMKFNLYRAKFKYSSAQLVFRNKPVDYISLSGYLRANTAVPLAIGDVVYAANTSNTSQILSNTAVYPYGEVIGLDELNQKVTLGKTNGLFSNTNFPVLKFFRVADHSNVALLTSNNLIATANLISLDDMPYHSIVPKFSFSEPAGSFLNMRTLGTSNSAGGYTYDSAPIIVANEYRYDLTDYERVVKSYSSENGGGFGANGTSTIIVNMGTGSIYSSPVMNMKTRVVDFISNKINNNANNENTKYGNALNKYISQTVSMDITAEDFKVYIEAYKPVGTDIKVYGRFLNNHDSSLIQDNPWTLMNINPKLSYTYSSSKDLSDYKTFDYFMPTGNTVANQAIAYMDPAAYPQANTLTYYGTNGAKFVGFDNFAVKIILLSTNQVIIPNIKTLSAIALMQ